MAPLHTVDYLTRLVQSMTSSELQHVTCTIHSDQPDQPSACNLQVMAAHGWASAMNGLRLLSFLEIVEYASSWRDTCLRGACLGLPLQLLAHNAVQHGGL